ncbi:MAG: hypothetical protein K8J09_16700, partial [Planctomycetes bacterium]|nr:hypothetical protein [Planctomycetota bacterium]
VEPACSVRQPPGDATSMARAIAEVAADPRDAIARATVARVLLERRAADDAAVNYAELAVGASSALRSG